VGGRRHGALAGRRCDGRPQGLPVAAALSSAERARGEGDRLIRLLRAGIALLALLVPTACGREAPSERGTSNESRDTLVLGAYTAPREAYRDAILPAFQKLWREKTGRTVVFQESYQGSGAQARAITEGFEADVAALSLEADVDRIAKAGLITRDWRQSPHAGIVSTSIVVLAVRQGNPKGIHDWADLARPGLVVLTPDPKTSGGAQWNVNAMYGAALRGFVQGVPQEDPAAARDFLARVFRNISIMDKGARESMTTFEKGVGDVAVTYEDEVLVGRKAGQTYEYVIPRSTILIENPVAVVDQYATKHGVRAVADAFVKFLWTPEVQRAFAAYGFRPVDPEVASSAEPAFPPVQDLWRIDYLGGWGRVSEELYGRDGVFTRMLEHRAQRR
jgi:sulfate transport system substrate-binding protein